MQSSHYQFTNLLYLVEQFRVCLSPLLYDIGFAVAAGKAATKREWMGKIWRRVHTYAGPAYSL